MLGVSMMVMLMMTVFLPNDTLGATWGDAADGGPREERPLGCGMQGAVFVARGMAKSRLDRANDERRERDAWSGWRLEPGQPKKEGVVKRVQFIKGPTLSSVVTLGCTPAILTLVDISAGSVTTGGWCIARF